MKPTLTQENWSRPQTISPSFTGALLCAGAALIALTATWLTVSQFRPRTTGWARSPVFLETFRQESHALSGIVSKNREAPRQIADDLRSRIVTRQAEISDAHSQREIAAAELEEKLGSLTIAGKPPPTDSAPGEFDRWKGEVTKEIENTHAARHARERQLLAASLSKDLSEIDSYFSSMSQKALKFFNFDDSGIANDTTAIIKWETNIKTDSRVEYGSTENLGAMSESTSRQPGLSHETTIRGLTNDEKVYYRANWEKGGLRSEIRNFVFRPATKIPAVPLAQKGKPDTMVAEQTRPEPERAPIPDPGMTNNGIGNGRENKVAVNQGGSVKTVAAPGERRSLTDMLELEIAGVLPAFNFTNSVGMEMNWVGIPDAPNLAQFKSTYTNGGFWVSKYEITRGQYEEIRKLAATTGFSGLALSADSSAANDSERLPVQNVKGDDARNAGLILTVTEHKHRKYEYKLPSISEWRFFANGASQKNAITGYNNQKAPRPVGSGDYKADFGLFDIMGNVSEWLSEPYDHSENRRFDPNFRPKVPSLYQTGENSKAYGGASFGINNKDTYLAKDPNFIGGQRFEDTGVQLVGQSHMGFRLILRGRLK